MIKIRVFLVDDHAVLRDGLTILINMQSDMEVVGHASDGRDILQQTRACEADIVVMDLSMPNLGGPQATALLRQECPDMRIIALTRHSESGYVRQMLQAGVHGYVLKQAAADELLTAIRTIATGGTYLDSTLTDRAVQAFIHEQTQDFASAERDLSDREADVVRLLAHGYSNKEIANQLGISVKTVDTYKSRAMEKLGIYGRAALVRYAIQQGWLNQK